MTDTIAFQILFKMNDADSAENVSKQIGKYTREARSHSTKDGAIAFGGTSSYSLEGTELITAQDILNIPNDEIIILVSGHKAKPIKIKAAYYFKEKDSLRKLNWKFDPTNGKPIEKENKQTQIIDMKETPQEAQPTPPNPQTMQTTQEPQQQAQESQEPQISEQEQQDIKQAQEKQALYEYEKALQEQEALKDKSQEDSRNNPKLLAFLEAEIPPHIMEELLKYSKVRVERTKRESDEAERLADMAEALEEEVRNIRQSIKKRMDSQQQKLINS